MKKEILLFCLFLSLLAPTVHGQEGESNSKEYLSLKFDERGPRLTAEFKSCNDLDDVKSLINRLPLALLARSKSAGESIATQSVQLDREDVPSFDDRGFEDFLFADIVHHCLYKEPSKNMYSVINERKWMSNDGKYSVRASLVDAQADTATLKKKDGEYVEVPLNRLDDKSRETAELAKGIKDQIRKRLSEFASIEQLVTEAKKGKATLLAEYRAALEGKAKMQQAARATKLSRVDKRSLALMNMLSTQSVEINLANLKKLVIQSEFGKHLIYDPTATLNFVSQSQEWEVENNEFTGTLSKISFGPTDSRITLADIHLQFVTDGGKIIEANYYSLDNVVKEKIHPFLDQLFPVCMVGCEKNLEKNLPAIKLPLTSQLRTQVFLQMEAEIDDETGLNKRIAAKRQDQSMVDRENKAIRSKQYDYYFPRGKDHILLTLSMGVYLCEMVDQYEKRVGRGIKADEIEFLVEQLIRDDTGYLGKCYISIVAMLEGLQRN